VGPWRAGARLRPGPGSRARAVRPAVRQAQGPDGTPLGRPPGGGKRAAEVYAALLAAEPRATAERRRELRARAGREARRSPLFFDLTLSLSKSISIFHASLGENARLAREAGDADGEGYWSGLVAESEVE
jgi:hypothetical protein